VAVPVLFMHCEKVMNGLDVAVTMALMGSQTCLVFLA
jgi:hypothetical protein